VVWLGKSEIIKRYVVKKDAKYIIVRYVENCIEDGIPESVDEVVEILFNILTCEFGREIINMHPIEFSAKYHHTLGLYIRNCFGLWRKDSKIMKELNALMPD